MDTIAQRLSRRLQTIVLQMDDLLDTSTIDYVQSRAIRESRRSGILLAGLSDGQWGPSTDEQTQIQRKLLEAWRPWLEQLQLLFSADTSERKRHITGAAAAVEGWIQRNAYEHLIPSTVKEAKAVFRRMTEPLDAALRALGEGSGRLLVVPDTNVLVRSPDITTYATALGTSEYTVLLVPGVLGELDAHKVNHNNPNVRERARKVSNRIKGWRNQGNLAEGVRVQGDIWVQVEGREPDFAKSLSWLRSEITDDRIIASILEAQRRWPTDRIALLTGDTLMLAKADAASIPSSDTPDPEA